MKTKPAYDFKLIDAFPDLSSDAFDWERHNQTFKENNVIIRARTKKVEFPKHWGCLSLKTVSNGPETYFIDDREYILNSDRYLILSNGVEYSSRIDDDNDVESFTINFMPRFEKTVFAAISKKEETLIDNPDHSYDSKTEFINTFYHFDYDIQRLVLQLNLLSYQFEENIGFIEEIYYDLLHLMMINQRQLKLQQQNVNALKYSTKAEIFKRILFARDYIESNYNRTVPIAAIATQVHMNPFHLIRHFRSIHGMSPHQYLKHVRLTRAYNMLVQERSSVVSIMEKCGYEDLSSFSKSFKFKFGFSPSLMNA